MATFTDIDLTFKAHPLTGDVSIKKDVHAVMQALTLLCITKVGDMVHDVDIAGSVDHLLFNTNSALFAYNLKQHLTQVIATHEPRVELKDIEIVRVGQPSDQEVLARISFYFMNSPQEHVFDLPVKRMR